jgi:uncharacterized protein (DUF2141 family)
MISILVSILMLLPISMTEGELSNTLHVHVHQANSDRGQIRVLIFAKADGFPDQMEKAMKNYSVSPKNNKCELTIEGLPAGVYAISVIHDEDGNGKLNTNPVGYPTEKFGFSNNPKIYFGPPSFEKASFELKNAPHTVRINLR